jgi:hypothetical protein
VAVVCLRLDDVHGGTPVDLLRTLDERVWAGRPVTLGVIPFPARGCLGAAGSLREIPGVSRRSLADERLRAYLEARSSSGAAEVAVHGVTHADHRSAGGPAVAELVAPSAARVAWLLRELDGFRARFGGATLIPPHNFIDAGVEERCLAAGFHVSRAVMSDEVARLGLDPRSAGARAEAKRRRPWYAAGAGLVVYQSAAVWADPVRRRGVSPEAQAVAVMDVVRPAGVGVVTFHWWDFLGRDGRVDEESAGFATGFLAACGRLGAEEFSTVPVLARHLAAHE